MKKVIICSLVVFLFVGLFRNSYAVPVNELKLELYLNDDQEVFVDDLIKYIDLVDDNIMINSSFNLSSKLNENYDFLTRFVISFVLDNLEYFDVIDGEKYKYIDEFGRELYTNKYIELDTLYDITSNIFGVDYYYIMDELLLVDGKIALIDFKVNNFDMKIEEIKDINIYDQYCDIYVKYLDTDVLYVYSFNIIDNNRLVISNLDIKG